MTYTNTSDHTSLPTTDYTTTSSTAISSSTVNSSTVTNSSNTHTNSSISNSFHTVTTSSISNNTTAGHWEIPINTRTFLANRTTANRTATTNSVSITDTIPTVSIDSDDECTVYGCKSSDPHVVIAILDGTRTSNALIIIICYHCMIY